MTSFSLWNENTWERSKFKLKKWWKIIQWTWLWQTKNFCSCCPYETQRQVPGRPASVGPSFLGRWPWWRWTWRNPPTRRKSCRLCHGCWLQHRWQCCHCRQKLHRSSTSWSPAKRRLEHSCDFVCPFVGAICRHVRCESLPTWVWHLLWKVNNRSLCPTSKRFRCDCTKPKSLPQWKMWWPERKIKFQVFSSNERGQ